VSKADGRRPPREDGPERQEPWKFRVLNPPDPDPPVEAEAEAEKLEFPKRPWGRACAGLSISPRRLSMRLIKVSGVVVTESSADRIDLIDV